MKVYDLIVNDDFQNEIIQKHAQKLREQNFVSILFQYPSKQLSQAAQEFSVLITDFLLAEEIYLEVNPCCLIEQRAYENIFNQISQSIKKLKKIQLSFGDNCKLGNLSFFLNLRISLQEFTLNIGKLNELNDKSYQNLQDFLSDQKDLQKLSIKIGQENCFGNENLEKISLALKNMTNLIEFSFDFDLSRINQNGLKVFSESLCCLSQLEKLYFNNSNKHSIMEGLSLVFDSFGYMKQLTDLRIVFEYEKVIYTEDSQILAKSFKNLNKLKHLELKGFNLFQLILDDELADILSSKINLETLILFFNKIPQKNQFFSVLSTNLEKLLNLKEFQFQISEINKTQQDSSEQFDFFSRALMKLKNLEILNFQIKFGNEFEIWQYIDFGDAIKSLVNLKQLELLIEDNNGLDRKSLTSLFEGVQQATGLENLKIKINTLKSKPIFSQFQIIGNALKNLINLKNLDIEILTDSIVYIQVKHLAIGLQLLTELVQLRINLKSQSNLSMQEVIFNQIQGHTKIEKLELLHECLSNDIKYYAIQENLKMCTANNLKELHIQLDANYFYELSDSFQQFFDTAQNLEIADIEIVYNMINRYGKDFLIFVYFLKLPSSLLDLNLKFKINKQILSDELMVCEMFQNLKNLKSLKIEFNNKITKSIIFDLQKCLSYCPKLVAFNLKLGFSLYQKEGQSLISMIKQLPHLRELELIIPYFTGFQKDFIQKFKQTLSSLNKLYYLNQSIKFLERTNTDQYDHINNLQNLVECQISSKQLSIDKKIQINHRVSQKFEQNDENNLEKQTENNVVSNMNCLSIQFNHKMTPFCYFESLKNLKNLSQLKELSLNLKQLVYFTKTEIQELRLGLSQLQILQKLSLNFEHYQGQRICKKLIYAIGKGLQSIQNVENLKLDILKDEQFSYQNYFQQLLKGIFNQKNIIKLNLELAGCLQSEFQILDFENILGKLNLIQDLSLQISGEFNEENQIKLGRGINLLQKLKYLSIKIKSKLEISLIGEESIIQAIENLNFLQEISVDVKSQKTKGSSKDQAEGNTVQVFRNKKCLSDCLFSFKNQTKLNIQESDQYLIDNIKEFQLTSDQNQLSLDNYKEFFVIFMKHLRKINKLKIEMKVEYVYPGSEKYVLISGKIDGCVDLNLKLKFQQFIENNIFSFLHEVDSVGKICLILGQDFYQNQLIFEHNFKSLDHLKELSIQFYRQSNSEQVFSDFSKGLRYLKNLTKLTMSFFQCSTSTKHLEELKASLEQIKRLHYLNLQFYVQYSGFKKYLINYIISFSNLSNLNQIFIKHSDYESEGKVERKLSQKTLQRKYLRLVNYSIQLVQFPYLIYKQDEIINKAYEEL